MIRSIKYTALFILIIVSSFILIISSCDSLNKDPEFIGTWQFTEKITSNDLVYNTTRILVLTENSLSGLPVILIATVIMKIPERMSYLKRSETG